MDRSRGADVKLPPPLLFVGATAIGWVLNRVAPMTILPPGADDIRRALGWALIALFGALASSAILLFHRAKTSVLPIRPSTALVESGPYRFTRNPMYLAMSCLVAGAALTTNNLWTLVGLVVAVLATNRFVIPREERHLESVFGEAYRAYKTRVRRWL